MAVMRLACLPLIFAQEQSRPQFQLANELPGNDDSAGQGAQRMLDIAKLPVLPFVGDL